MPACQSKRLLTKPARPRTVPPFAVGPAESAVDPNRLGPAGCTRWRSVASTGAVGRPKGAVWQGGSTACMPLGHTRHCPATRCPARLRRPWQLPPAITPATLSADRPERHSMPGGWRRDGAERPCPGPHVTDRGQHHRIEKNGDPTFPGSVPYSNCCHPTARPKTVARFRSRWGPHPCGTRVSFPPAPVGRAARTHSTCWGGTFVPPSAAPSSLSSSLSVGRGHPA